MTQLVYVCMTTYTRTETAIKTLQALVENLHYPTLAFHIADDGTGGNHIDRLLEAVGPTYKTSATDAGRKGVGKSMNIALDYIFQHTPVVLMMEDDWLLQKPLYLEVPVAVLMNHTTVGMIRYGWLSTGIRSELVGLEGRCWWKLIHNSHQYVYSGQVSLRHQRMYDFWGFHSEGVNAGQQELDYCLNVSQKPGMDILWPSDGALNHGYFAHIGDESLNAVQPE